MSTPLNTLETIQSILDESGRTKEMSDANHALCQALIKDISENGPEHIGYSAELLAEHIDMLLDEGSDRHSFSARLMFANKAAVSLRMALGRELPTNEGL